MTDRVIYISRNCPHCKKLLLGIHKYDFLRSQFIIVDVLTQQYPDYIDTVPTLVANQQMIKSNDVFGYMNNMVDQIFKQNPQLREKYHPQGPSQGQGQGHGQGRGPIGQVPQKITGPTSDPIDEIVGWCPDGGCSFSPISDSNDDFSKSMVSLEDTRYGFISDENDKLTGSQNITKIPMEQDNEQFQKSAKQQQMDQSYERLMNERKLISR